MNRSAKFSVAGKPLARNTAYCVGSVHGTTDPSSTQPANSVLPTWFPLWSGKGRKPVYIIKRFYASDNFLSEADLEELEYEVATATAGGAAVLFQVADNNTREAGGTAALANDTLDRLRTKPDYLTLGNEMDLFNRVPLEDLPAYHTERIQLVRLPEGTRWVPGSWASLQSCQTKQPELSRAIAKLPGYIGRKVAPVGAYHNYDYMTTWNWTAASHLSMARAMGIRTLANVETDLDFSSSDRWTAVGGVFALANNLEHAMRDIICCDFTLQAAAGVGEGGNGLFKESGDPHISGILLRDWAQPFTRVPLRWVGRDYNTHPNVHCFVNALDEVILAVSKSPPQNAAFVQALFNMVRNDRPVEYDADDLTAALGGDNPAGNFTKADWDLFRHLYTMAVDSADTDWTEIEVPSLSGNYKVKDSIGAYEMGPGGFLSATLSPNSAVYLCPA